MHFISNPSGLFASYPFNYVDILKMLVEFSFSNLVSDSDSVQILSQGLVEIRTVDTGCVVIKGVESSRYLCMEANGKLYGSVSDTLLINKILS